jgi:hypothetical protein
VRAINGIHFSSRNSMSFDASACLAYPIRDVIPILLENEARTLSDEEIHLLHSKAPVP